MVPNIKRLILFNTLSVHFFETNKTDHSFQGCFGHSSAEGTLVHHNTKLLLLIIAAFLYRTPKRDSFSLGCFILMKPVWIEGKTHWVTYCKYIRRWHATYSWKTREKKAMDAGEFLPTFLGIACNDGLEAVWCITDVDNVFYVMPFLTEIARNIR